MTQTQFVHLEDQEYHENPILLKNDQFGRHDGHLGEILRKRKIKPTPICIFVLSLVKIGLFLRKLGISTNRAKKLMNNNFKKKIKQIAHSTQDFPVFF